MTDIVSGAIVVGYLVSALFFLKFWSRTDDRFFLTFALSFALLAAQRLMLALLADEQSMHVYLYGLRLLAFVLILWAIVDKNREGRAVR